MRPNAVLCGALLFGLVLPVICRRRVEIIEEPDEDDDFPCPEQFGYYSDATNCSRYHICDHGKASVKSCDDGLVFSTILKTCDWPYNVHCNTADAEFTRQNLRLRGNKEDINNDNGVDQNDQVPTNRRQPVLANEDDSYWLGRPETTLLNLGDDDEFTDNYHYEEPQRLPNKKRPKSQNVPRQDRRQESREENNNDEEEGNEGNGPWFHSLNFDQIRRQEDRKPSMFRRIENNTAPVRTRPTTTTTTTTTTTPAPFISTNQRGGGWGRHSQRNRPAPTRTTELPQLLPRKALRIGNVDDDVLLTEDLDINRANEDNSDLDQDVFRRQKEPQESYRLVPTTARALPTTTSAPENLRPLHLGSSRRRGNRKQNNPATTQSPPTTTPRPQTNPPRQWNSRVQPSNPRTPVNNQDNSARRTIADNPFKQFERRPVLRDSEDAPARENFDDDSDDDGLDEQYFNMPLEIRKKNTDDDDSERRVTIPVPKDVSNSLDTRRQPRPNKVTTQAPPRQPKQPKRVDPESIYKAFQAGFHQAVKPTPASHLRSIDDDGNTFRVNPSVDMEYEDVGNEDEDENVEEADHNDGSAHEDTNTNKPNKEIVVRYDDEEEEPVVRKPANSRNTVTPRPVTIKPYTTAPPATRSASPTPPRLTQFVDIVVRNNNNQPENVSPASNRSPQNTAIHVLDLISKQKKLVNPNARSILNFGFVPTLGSNNSLVFFPPPPPSPQISPKQPRHTSSVLTTDKPKKTQKVKPLKKQAKSNKNEFTSSKPKKFHKVSPPKVFQKGHFGRAKRCVPEQCQPPNCRCGGTDIPGGFAPNETPQIVLLTFDDSVNDLNREIYKKLFEQGRKNPNGCPIRSTFYVSHEWTDYAQVQNLYAKGHEMASHSISHSFGEKFSKERWLSEIAGQREIMSLYGGVDWRDVRGMRAPFLQTGGNTMFEMLHEANFSYDSSMPVYDIDPPYWPYTLDYTVNHDCMIEPCPTHSIPGLWEVGMVMWEDLRGGRCSMADGCFNPSDEEGVYNMVKQNFFRHYNSNKAPFGMYFHSRWFLTDHNMKGFSKFLDEMLQMKDVYIVTNWQMIQWMQRPTPLSQLKSFAPFGCDDIRDRPPLCKQPHTCKVRFRSETRTLRTCQTCPRMYPWTGNNGLEDEAQ